MDTYGLLGYPLGHSFSRRFFEEKFKKENINAQFNNFEIDSIDKFTKILKSNPTLKGLSVTIPYKETIIPFIDELSEEAKIINAVNSIQISRKGNIIRTKGYNTDAYGFKLSLLDFIKGNKSDAIILGTGGASKAIEYTLNNLNIKYKIASRAPQENQIAYSSINEIINTHKIIINTTPLGMFPNIETYPLIPYEELDKSYYLYDLTYNPELTTFMKKGLENGANVKNGLEMLHLQAEKSWEIWNKA